MKHKLTIIIALLILNLSVTGQSLLEQNRAMAFYKIMDYVTFTNDIQKGTYIIATYGCSPTFVQALKKQKPNSFLTGNSYTINEYNPKEGVAGVDILFVDESKNSEYADIYSKTEKIAKTGASILIVSNNLDQKDKVLINFEYTDKSLEPTIEYSLPNCSFFNIAIDEQNFKSKFTNIVNIDVQKSYESQLKNVEKDLKDKEDQLNKTISDLKAQEAKLNEQKKLIDNQQSTIDTKQKEIEKQQANLQKLIAQMQETKIKLQQQEQNYHKKELELQEKQQAILQFQGKIEMMQNQFAQQSSIIEKQKKAVEEVTNQIEQKKKELGNLTNTVRLQRYALTIFGFLLAIIVLLTTWIFRNFRKMKEQNNVLEQQKNEIMTQAEELEKANLELEKLSIVASQTSNAVAILDLNGKFDWVNAGFTKLYGYTLQLLHDELDENINKNILYSGISEYLEKAISSNQSFYFEHEAITRNDSKIWIQSSITPIVNYDGKIKQIVVVDTDISVIKKAEQQIAQQNKDIKKSITYASRIQNATLPSEKLIESYLPQSFVLFLPRDIVSGDFYWIYKAKNKTFFAAADCTGHGVPGAFMSMLGITLLNEVLSHLDDTPELLHPNIILDNLRDKLIVALRQSENETSSKDGIAIALCMTTENSNVLEFAGAENQMLLVRNKEYMSYSADDMSIGINVGGEKKFTNNQVEVQKNDMVYLFSDGYVDQFGGPKHKKFLIARLRELFIEIATEDTNTQKNKLHDTHVKWKGNNDQIDDIIIFGSRIL